MLKSNAGLKERLAGWTDIEMTVYHIGANLGFWPEFGAPPGEDPWHGFKEVVGYGDVGNTILIFMDEMVDIGMLEYREPECEYRWNSNFEGFEYDVKREM